MVCLRGLMWDAVGLSSNIGPGRGQAESKDEALQKKVKRDIEKGNNFERKQEQLEYVNSPGKYNLLVKGNQN